MWTDIRTPAQAIDLLGGNAKVAAMFASVKPKTVSMWRHRGIPARAWIVLGARLKRQGARFSPKLFDMLEPRSSNLRRGGRDGGLG